jgi:TatD DNase family protein
MCSPDHLLGIIKDTRLRSINLIISMAMDITSAATTVHIAETYPNVKAAVGIHPWNAVLPTDEILEKLKVHLQNKEVVALGEIGLDYQRSKQSPTVQKKLLIAELKLAQESNLPINLHCRGAHQDMIDILRQQTGISGIIHGFSGDEVSLQDWLELDFYISIGRRGFIIDETPSLSNTIKSIPLERLLTETDATGSTSTPTDVIPVVNKLAELYEISTEKITTSITENLKRVLKL